MYEAILYFLPDIMTETLSSSSVKIMPRAPAYMHSMDCKYPLSTSISSRVNWVLSKLMQVKTHYVRWVSAWEKHSQGWHITGYEFECYDTTGTGMNGWDITFLSGWHDESQHGARARYETFRKSRPYCSHYAAALLAQSIETHTQLPKESTICDQADLCWSIARPSNTRP